MSSAKCSSMVKNGKSEIMIKVTTFRDTEIIINADLIESVEKTPDTIITLTTGKKLMVKQTVEEIVEAVVAYRQRVFMNLLERKS